jgi:hypothetical protein
MGKFFACAQNRRERPLSQLPEPRVLRHLLTAQLSSSQQPKAVRIGQ